MKKGLIILLVAATLGVAAIFLYRRRKANGGVGESEDYSPGEAPTPAQGFPVFPAILLGEVKGVAAVTKNPGNLRPTGDNWQGMIGEYKGFIAFSDYAYGVRALLKNLVTAMNKHGRTTIDQIITAYAPETENNTFAYIQNVMLWTGKKPEAKLSLTDIPNLATAIIRMETGISAANQTYLFNYVKQVNQYFNIV